MKKQTHTNTKSAGREDRPLPTTWRALTGRLALRPIRDNAGLERARRIMDRLAVLDKRSNDQDDFLDAMAALVEAYERERLADISADGGPVEILRHLLDEHDMSASALGRLLGHRETGAAILRGDRQMSKRHIAIIADHFAVDPGLFLGKAKA